MQYPLVAYIEGISHLTQLCLQPVAYSFTVCHATHDATFGHQMYLSSPLLSGAHLHALSMYI